MARARSASDVDSDRRVDPAIEVADEVEDGGQGRRDVQVVVERGTERGVRGGQGLRERTRRPDRPDS